MTLEAVRESYVPSKATSELIPQPDRPTLPMRVPVLAECGGGVRKADIIGSTEGVLLLQSGDEAPVPTLGTPIRLRVEWDRQVLTGRIAAHGVAGRYLVSLGERPIRRSRRFTVDLAGTARCVHLYGPTQVRVTDLSTGGARVRGLDLPIGTDVELQFTPPGQSAPLTVLAFVVRSIPSEVPTVGVAFRMVQPSMDVLATHATTR
jgi:PilZ domain